ncbi:MAG TPA: trypsin-like serine protease [Thiotrichales bacterium]|nr:trypsin-like serine protease [Thiotrichales bacterium]
MRVFSTLANPWLCRCLPPAFVAMVWSLLSAGVLADQQCTSEDELPSVLQRVSAAVVNLRTSDATIGSGFVLDDGLIVTSAHLTAGRRLLILYQDGRRVPWHTLYVDRELDLAIARVEGTGLPHLTLRADTPSLGETVLALGNPFGLGLTVTRGIVSAQPRAIGQVHRLQTDAAINPGNSGGPLVDRQGRVVGMISARAAIGSGIGFAVPAAAIRKALEEATQVE